MSESSKKLAYSLVELARQAGVGRSFLYQEIRAGRLKVKKAGRRTLVLENDVTNWLAGFPALSDRPSDERAANKQTAIQRR